MMAVSIDLWWLWIKILSSAFSNRQNHRLNTIQKNRWHFTIHHCIGHSSIRHPIWTHWFICWREILGLEFLRCQMHLKMPVYMLASSALCFWVCVSSMPNPHVWIVKITLTPFFSSCLSLSRSSQAWFAHIACTCWSAVHMNCVDAYKCHRWVFQKCVTWHLKLDQSVWGDMPIWRGLSLIILSALTFLINSFFVNLKL